MSTQPSPSKVKLCSLTLSNVQLLNNGFLCSDHLPLLYPCHDDSTNVENFCDWSYFKNNKRTTSLASTATTAEKGTGTATTTEGDKQKKGGDKIIINKSCHLWHTSIVNRVTHQADILINDTAHTHYLPTIRTTKATRLLHMNVKTNQNRQMTESKVDAYCSKKYSSAAGSVADSSIVYFKKKYNKDFPK